MNVFNYTLNKLLPYFIIAGLSFYSLGWLTFEPYVILAAAIFVDHFSYRSGYAVAWCRRRGLLDDYEEDEE